MRQADRDDRRKKISHDPNNTHWASSTTNYGHRILTSQGWTPGTYLGAHNASQAGSYSAASLSRIRVTLKEDTLGLGAKIQAGAVQGEHAGLDAFQSLLGRLNGRSEAENIRAQSVRHNVRRVTYVEQRWGAMRFVKGGLLVGTKSDEETEDVSQEAGNVSQEAGDATVADMAIGESQNSTRQGTRKERKRKQGTEGEEHSHQSQDKLHGTATGKKGKEDKRLAKAPADTSLPSQSDSPIRDGSENVRKETKRGKKDKDLRRKKKEVERVAETGIPSSCKKIHDRSEEGTKRKKKKSSS